MKNTFATVLFLALFTLASPPLTAQNTAQGSYNQGVLLFNQGKFEEALMIFEQVLQSRPDFVYARSYATKCKNALAQNLSPKNDLEGKLARIIIPEINFAETPLGDVLDYFTTRAQEISKGETVVNFIYKGTTEQRASTLITLSLRNVPMSEALRYVGQLSRTQVKYEAHAVVIDPAAPAPEIAPAAPASTFPATPAAPKDPFQ